MKKELKGYEIVFTQRQDKRVFLTPDEGNRLQQTLAGDPPRFIHLMKRELTIRTGAIDYLRPVYRQLEERCLMCGNPKPVAQRCPCEEPSQFGKDLGGMLPRVKSIEPEAVEEKHCKTCDIFISKGEYCVDCEKVYGDKAVGN